MTSTLHIVVAMKPLDGNFASNAIKHGVAGLNIDACRIGGIEDTSRPQGKDIRGGNWSGNGGRSILTTGGGFGRFPANVILAHKKGCRLVGTSKVGGDKPRGIDAAKSRSWKNQSVAGIARVGYADADGKETTEVWKCEEGCPVKAFPGQQGFNDSGLAARFFKQVKED